MKKPAIFFSLVVLGLIIVGCQPGGGPLKSPAVEMALKAPEDSSNRQAVLKNDEGVSHLVQEHWDIAAGFFREAIAADPNLAEAHFNLALSLHEMKDHTTATEHFGKAKELSPNNPKIADNEILKDHLK